MPDYTFYTTEYLGDSISGEDFFRLSKRAAEQLALYKRMYTVNAPDSKAEDMAICAMEMPCSILKPRRTALAAL